MSRQPEPFWAWWVSMVPDPEPAPEPEPAPLATSPWDIEKRANRLARKVSQIERGVLQPRFQFAAQAPAELASAKTLLREVAAEVMVVRR